jgi:hypothetical protein
MQTHYFISMHKFIVVYLLIILLLSGACNIQKRRYSSGFYLNHGPQPKTGVYQITDKLEASQSYNSDIKVDSVFKNEATLENYDQTITSENKFVKQNKKLLVLNADTTIKKQEKNTVQEGSLSVKPKMELFSKLALFAMLINISMVITIPVLGIFFTLPELLIVLILLSLFAPAFPLLLALEGKYRVNKYPKKYKWPNLADFIQIITAFLFAISLLYFLIFALVGGISSAGW